MNISRRNSIIGHEVSNRYGSDVTLSFRSDAESFSCPDGQCVEASYLSLDSAADKKIPAGVFALTSTHYPEDAMVLEPVEYSSLFAAAARNALPRTHLMGVGETVDVEGTHLRVTRGDDVVEVADAHSAIRFTLADWDDYLRSPMAPEWLMASNRVYEVPVFDSDRSTGSTETHREIFFEEVVDLRS
jgi:hypothetical protein